MLLNKALDAIFDEEIDLALPERIESPFTRRGGRAAGPCPAGIWQQLVLLRDEKEVGRVVQPTAEGAGELGAEGMGSVKFSRGNDCPMSIRVACVADIPMVCSVLNEAAQWLAADLRPLWSPVEIAPERVESDVGQGLFYLAQADDHTIGVMKFELEDRHFWPEIPLGSSAYVHKLAVRRAWAKQGVSTELLAFARKRTAELGRSYLRLDCVADRQGLRALYEGFGFSLHSVVQRGRMSYARYEIDVL